MKILTKKWTSLICCCTLSAAILLPASDGRTAESRLAFSGGPEGGTFRTFSRAISSRLSEHLPLDVSDRASAGSIENLRRVNSAEADFGIAYSGDLFLARSGQLPQDPKKYENALVLGRLYGASAHLMVLEESGIKKVADLAGRKVGVGGAGSGAAISAHRYFVVLGLWDKIRPQFIGYSEAVAALSDRRIDAVWVFAGIPNPSAVQAAARSKIIFLDIMETVRKEAFFKQYPFYTDATIPSGSYAGIETGVKTFQDSALWIAGKNVKPEIAYRSLKEIYSPQCLRELVKLSRAATEMRIEGGLKGVVTPLHPGAEKFWAERGKTPYQR